MYDMKYNKFGLTLFILLLFVSSASAGVHTPDFSKRRQVNSVRSSSAVFSSSGYYNPFNNTAIPVVENINNNNKTYLSVGQVNADLNLKPADAPSGRSLVTSEISDPFTGGLPSRSGLVGPGRGENDRNDWRVEGPGKNPHEWDFNTGLNPWFSTPLIVAQPLGDAIVPMLLMALVFAFFKFRKD